MVFCKKLLENRSPCLLHCFGCVVYGKNTILSSGNAAMMHIRAGPFSQYNDLK
ncbi:hypothetical protein ABFV83_12520 [Lacrimispora sp. BS-2]|uniref:Uncharacterized protein n=1 Tax=Lacrimispora sp. BS-2 TaxID=3151850 RepID=A0AAU7PK47_9FIRM